MKKRLAHAFTALNYEVRHRPTVNEIADCLISSLTDQIAVCCVLLSQTQGIAVYTLDEHLKILKLFPATSMQ